MTSAMNRPRVHLRAGLGPRRPKAAPIACPPERPASPWQDGSSYYNDSSNFLVYGGCKNYKGDHKICGPDNVIVYPGIDGRSSGGRSCQTNDNPGFKFNEFSVLGFPER